MSITSSTLGPLVALALVVGATTAAAGQRAGGAPPIVGTWQVVEYWVRDAKSGERQYPYGRQPGGYHVYDATGHVVVQMMRLPAADTLGASKWRALPPDEQRKLLERYAAYFGTYRADTARGVIAEHIDGDLAREHAGTSRDVPFRLDGDRLLLGDGTWSQTVLMRVY